MHEGTLRLFESKLGSDHPTTFISRNALAAAYESVGRWGEAEALLRESLARRRKTQKADSPLLGGDLAELGGNLLHQEKGWDAAPLLRESLAIRANAVPDDWSRFNTMSQLGGSLLGEKKYLEAEPLVVAGYEGIKVREAKIPAASKRRVAEAAVRVVRLYERWDKPEKAQEWKRNSPSVSPIISR